MDVVILFNGLGNQMSQYAFYLAKKKKSPRTIAIFDPDSTYNHNGFELGKVFGITMPSRFISRILIILYKSLYRKGRKFWVELLGVRQIKESLNYDYDEKMLLPGPRGINFYWGGWHSERYFKSIEPLLNSVFRFPSDNSNEYLFWQEKIQNVRNSVSIHIRRGDYVNIAPDDYYQLDKVASVDYYKKATDWVRGKFSDCVFFVFSDDIPWCRDNFGDEGYFYVDCNTGTNAWRDMSLMTMCHHHINANSTFSWWGAWLNETPGSVVIRPKWFIRDIETKDFYPQEWIVIE